MNHNITTEGSGVDQLIEADVVIAGCGVAGLFCALQLPASWRIVILSKDALEHSNSFLAQGGICVLRDEADYDSYYEDTMRAGHYENSPASVELMIRQSPEIIRQLVSFGVDFEQENGVFLYTREGAHSAPRILFHADITGQEITSKLLAAAKQRPNITFLEYTTMTDLLVQEDGCHGMVATENATGHTIAIEAGYQVLATGGIGGRYDHSTNYPHLTGDALTLAERYGIGLEHLDYVQIHPTTLYSKKPGRRFLISESVRGEGALLYNHAGERFVEELLPRDVVTQAIRAQMAQEGTDHVWLDMRPIGKEALLHHFPHIYQHCLEEGYDPAEQLVPVVPAQHYFMGGVAVDLHGATSMPNLYAVGETACNNVHGANRLASNSLLESMVWARQAAVHMQGRKQMQKGASGVA